MQPLLHFQRASSLASMMSLSLLAAPSLGGSDTLLPGKTEARGSPDSTLCPGSPHTTGTPGDMDTGFATQPSRFWAPQHPSQLLGCQHPNSPDLPQPGPAQPLGSHRGPQPRWEPGAFKALPSTSSLIPQ